MAVDRPDNPDDGDERSSLEPQSRRGLDAATVEGRQLHGARTDHRIEDRKAAPETRATVLDANIDLDRWTDPADESRKPDRLILRRDRVHHVLVGDPVKAEGGHKHGSGVPGKSTFPPDWDDKKILSTIVDVARRPDWPPLLQDHGTWKAEGWRDDVLIVVIVTPSGVILTGHPTEGRGVHINDDQGNPQAPRWPNKE